MRVTGSCIFQEQTAVISSNLVKYFLNTDIFSNFATNIIRTFIYLR